MTLYHYPPQTALKRVIPKTRIYDGAGASTALRDRFAREVDQILWAHKLAPETLNLPATKSVPEIQVIHLTPKADSIHDDILRAIDRAIPFPLIFEIHHGAQIEPAAAYKRPSDADRTKWVMHDPLRAPRTATRAALPVAVNMGALYDRMLAPFIPVTAQAGEDVETRLARAAAIRAKEKEISALHAKMRRETQFNIKLTLHGQLAEAQAAFEHLKKGPTGE
jgi:hypothetical protein